MKSPTLKDLLAVATEAAYLGGRRTLAYFNTNLSVETKADQTPVTIADRESEEIIRAHITRFFPSHAILGEEGGKRDGDPDYRWIIDPIDGTKTFIHGVPMYGVMIGVEVKGDPAVGAIYIPPMDEMVSAARGLGCTWNSRPASVSNVNRLEEATLLTTAPEVARARSDAYDRLIAKTKLHRSWGDCYGYILVATGRAEIMIDPIMNPWDCAPLVPILEEAGGHFTDWSGKRTIWGPDGAATNHALHDEVVEILRSEKKK
jgi:histidinol-phosphatase